MLASSEMADASFPQRIEMLERTVTALATLPARVDRVEQALTEFRAEVRQEFAAVRSELPTELTSAIQAAQEETGRQMFMMHEDLVQRINGSEEETRRQMRVLHEDLVQRLKTLGEAR
jgi:hypothetical protein